MCKIAKYICLSVFAATLISLNAMEKCPALLGIRQKSRPDEPAKIRDLGIDPLVLNALCVLLKKDYEDLLNTPINEKIKSLLLELNRDE